MVCKMSLFVSYLDPIVKSLIIDELIHCGHTKKTETLVAIAMMSAHETTPGHLLSKEPLQVSMRV